MSDKVQKKKSNSELKEEEDNVLEVKKTDDSKPLDGEEEKPKSKDEPEKKLNVQNAASQKVSGTEVLFEVISRLRISYLTKR